MAKSSNLLLLAVITLSLLTGCPTERLRIERAAKKAFPGLQTWKYWIAKSGYSETLGSFDILILESFSNEEINGEEVLISTDKGKFSYKKIWSEPKGQLWYSVFFHVPRSKYTVTISCTAIPDMILDKKYSIEAEVDSMIRRFLVASI